MISSNNYFSSLALVVSMIPGTGHLSTNPIAAPKIGYLVPSPCNGLSVGFYDNESWKITHNHIMGEANTERKSSFQ
jgi:hypothetical protein